ASAARPPEKIIAVNVIPFLAVWPPRPSATANSQRPAHPILVVLPDQAGLGRGGGRQRETAPSSQRATSRIHGLTVIQGGHLLPARRPPPGLPAIGQIRKTCGVPAYLRVVIESNRTQASRTMNAETAQAATDRVN